MEPQPDPKAIYQLALQIAAAENGCACSGEEPPEPDGDQYLRAKEQLLSELNKTPSIPQANL